MQSTKRLKITDVNPHLICVLCGGYYIDATTIIECLHSFCKSCIVKYLQNHKYCPICDVQVHKSFPLLNIRRDKTLQDIVYKLVPSLFQKEMRRRAEFYTGRPESEWPSETELRGELPENGSILLPDEPISICLEESITTPPQPSKRFLKVPAAVKVGHLEKLLRGKFGLSTRQNVCFFFKDDPLPSSLTVMDIAYIYQWRRKTPIHLTYQMLDPKKNPVKKKTIVIEEKAKESTEEKKEPLPSKEEWKEVHLEISENGVMSVRGVSHREPVVSVSKVRKEEEEVQGKKGNKAEVSIRRVNKGEALDRIVKRLSPEEHPIGSTSVSIRAVPPPQATKPPRYKTLKTPTKPWNPTVDRSAVVRQGGKFFKMRELPRYLGNPASGVTRMYRIADRPPPYTPKKPTPPAFSPYHLLYGSHFPFPPYLFPAVQRVPPTDPPPQPLPQPPIPQPLPPPLQQCIPKESPVSRVTE